MAAVGTTSEDPGTRKGSRMIYRRPEYQPTAYDDDWEDIPASGFVPKWLGGVVGPLVLIGYGVSCFVTGHGAIPAHIGSMEVYGANAAALGSASCAAALMLHCHYFW